MSKRRLSRGEMAEKSAEKATGDYMGPYECLTISRIDLKKYLHWEFIAGYDARRKNEAWEARAKKRKV